MVITSGDLEQSTGQLLGGLDLLRLTDSSLSCAIQGKVAS